MQLTVKTRLKFRGYAREVHKVDSVAVYQEGGYRNVKEMQKELLRRFPNRPGVRNRRIKHGIVRIEGGQLDHRTTVVTLT